MQEPARLHNRSQPEDISADPWSQAVAGAAPLRLGDFPSVLFLRVANVLHHEVASVYSSRHGLTLPEWRILGRLDESAPIRLSTLCRVSFIDKAQVTRILRELESRGLASTHPDPAHRHRRIVDITPAGRTLAQQVFAEAIAAQMSLLTDLTDEERAVTYRTLCKVLAKYGAQLPSDLIAQEETGT